MTQDQALDILKTGGNAFVTGEPGAGKTYVINQYIAWLEAAGVTVAVTASTGIAATHIAGMTIHSWSGIGARDVMTPQDLDSISTREKIVKRMKKTKVLVIDEISMLDGRLLEMVDKVCKTVRQSEESFGGIQIIFVGDFFQLPPVTRRGDVMRYAFESYAWQESKPLICYITDQHRQEDELLLGLLQSIRRNDVEEDHYTLLAEQTEIGYENIEPTKLYTHNADVDSVNATKLKELAGDSVSFKMTARGSKPLLEGLVKNCLSPEVLQLKEDAMVMCTKNNFEAGYVNGTLGRVVRFDYDDGFPVIQTASGREIKVAPTNWDVIEDGKVLAGIEQVPLRLAWAITVHKSQGMSLDAAEIDLSKAFVYGQGYVALSRVRTLAGLKMLGIGTNSLSVDPKVVHFDKKFREESEGAEDAFSEMGEDEIEKMHSQFVTACGGKLPKAGEVRVVESNERLKKESTLEETKRLLLEGKSVLEIAKERSMVESTIWTHVEKLTAEKDLTAEQLESSFDKYIGSETVYTELAKIMAELGIEKLKPIFEAADEKYDYDTIRVARIKYQLDGDNQ